jgi:6-phosphogluconolactonase
VIERMGPFPPVLSRSLAMPSNATTIVYVANADSREISILRMDRKTGALTAVDTLAVGGAVMPLAISPDRRFLYAALRSEPFSYASFAIDRASGRLTSLATVPAPDSMAYIATDRTGRHLLGASYGGNQIAISPIGADGSVAATPSQVVATKPNAHSILPDPSNRFVFVASLGGNVLLQFRFDAAAGTVSPNAPPEIAADSGAGARHLVFHPNGRAAYLINELDASIYALAFDAASGTMKRVQRVSALPPGFAGKPWASDIHITTDGRFLYGAERGSHTLAGFRVDAAGMLSPLGSTPTEQQPRGFAIDPRGRFLLATGQTSHGMTVYAIDPDTGALAACHRVEVGKNPNWVEIVDLD